MKRIVPTMMLGMAVIATAVVPPLSRSRPVQSAAFEVASIKLRVPVPGTVFRLATRDYLFGISGTRIVDELATPTDLIMDAYKFVGGELLFFKENQLFTRQMNPGDILAGWGSRALQERGGCARLPNYPISNSATMSRLDSRRQSSVILI